MQPKKASVRKWALWGAVIFATIGSAYCFSTPGCVPEPP